MWKKFARTNKQVLESTIKTVGDKLSLKIEFPNMNIFETKSEVLNAHYVQCNSRLIDYSNITIKTKRTLDHCCPSLCHLPSILLDAESNDVDRYRVLNVVSNNASVVEGQCVRWTGDHAHEDSGTAVLSRPSLESTTGTQQRRGTSYVRPPSHCFLSYCTHTVDTFTVRILYQTHYVL